MNVIQNQKKAKPRKTNYRQNVNFKVQEANPDQIINQKVLLEISKDVLGNTTIINSSGESQVILALTEGRGHARGEVGIAALDINSPTLVLCQISDDLHYSDALNKILILNPVKILLPDTMFDTKPPPKLIQLIMDTFGQINIVPVHRRHFNDKYGLELIKNLCSAKSSNILPIIARKYYCLSSASSLFTYLKNIKVAFGKNCLKVDYQTKQGGMMIDSQTASRLELLYSLNSDKSSKKFSLFAILNKCETRIGQRHLRANILEPSCNIDFIRNRQEKIKILLEKDELLSELKENLQNFRSVDQLLKVSCIVPADEVEKAIETNIQMAILLKQCLEGVKPLCDFMQNTVSESFEDARQMLSASIFTEIIEKINNVIQPDIHMNRLAQKHFQHLFAVRSNVNESIDFLRKLYTEAVEKIRDYVTELAEQCQLPFKMTHSTKLGHHLLLKNVNNIQIPEEINIIKQNGINFYMTTPLLEALNTTTRTLSLDVIRMSNLIICNMLVDIASEIDAIDHLICIVIDLDLVQSLAETSSHESYCCPSFGKVMRIENAFHPMLEISKTTDDMVTNNVIATPQYNFYVISGPNMSGKTIYIKMIAVIQIMAQIGCFVPGSNAILRITDKLFSRIGFEDNIEQGASSFTVELREMEYIYTNLTPNSLVIMDELCRSTNPQEGEKICWDFSEKLLKFIGVSDDYYYKVTTENEDDEMNETTTRTSRSNTTLQFRGCEIKLKDVARPFIYLTTHFTALTKIVEKHNNAINLHMAVEQKFIEDKLRLEFKYKIRSGPTSVKSYGLALARCLRFPTSLIDRAEEIVDQVKDESFIDFDKSNRTAVNRQDDDHDSMDTTETSVITQEMTELDKEVIDLFSYVLLLMSSDGSQEVKWISIDMVNQKLSLLVEKMSPEFRELIRSAPLEDIIRVLNASKVSDTG